MRFLKEKDFVVTKTGSTAASSERKFKLKEISTLLKRVLQPHFKILGKPIFFKV